MDNTQSFQWPTDISMETSAGDFILPDEDFYQFIRLDDATDVKPVAEMYNKKGNKLQAIFHFSIWDNVDDQPWEPGEPTINQFFTLSMNEKSHLYPIVKAIMGGTVDPKWVLTPSDIIGKYFKAKVEHTEKNAKGQVYARIVPSSATVQKKLPVTSAGEKSDGAPF